MDQLYKIKHNKEDSSYVEKTIRVIMELGIKMKNSVPKIAIKKV